ncbi:MAG: uroporphyrinogen decarboxylase [Acidobacteria bacterium]|nr:MAG: uroporphyrinogen decarboxylase [Acidobacteriota bacterium]
MTQDSLAILSKAASPLRSAAALQIGHARLHNALARRPQSTPPIWLMRQAGRYHKHYQALREKYSFMDLCKRPELAAEVALGPVLDFDFDAAILFSDLLFPLEALGMGLEYTDRGPQLEWRLNEQTISQLRSVEEARPHLLFQGDAVRATRERLPSSRSLIGFAGGPWTLFAYAVEGSHKGSLIESKKLIALFPRFCEVMVPLLARSIELQLNSGAELVMIFDTAAGELSPNVFKAEIVPQLRVLREKVSFESLSKEPRSDEMLHRIPTGLFPEASIGYYSKGTQPAHLRHALFTDGFAGIGVDHRWDLREAFDLFPKGFVQGNFDQALLLCEPAELKRQLRGYLEPLVNHSRAGWVCGLGHGVLPDTPEDNVKLFVDTIRERCK